MRRELASLLLGLISFPLIAPLLLASTDSDLPACCRRDGKHHCSMASGNMEASMTGEDSEPGPAVDPIQPKCPYYPATGAAPIVSSIVLPESSQAISLLLFSHPAARTQTQALNRISFSRSRQKRGPPLILS
jgi:hypothetical protein